MRVTRRAPQTGPFPRVKNYSVTRLRILVELHKRGPLGAVHLMGDLGIKATAVGCMMCRMARDGEIQRSSAKSSVVRYEITELGRDQLKLAYSHATGMTIGVVHGSK